MYCIKIRLNAYKRLAATGCNTDGRILAFVGANESGKSSMLEALVWLTSEDADPLPLVYQHRGSAVGEQDAVVEAEFELDDEDLAILRDLDTAEQPRTFVLQRRKDGSQGSDARPNIRRNPQPFEQAASKLIAAKNKMPRQFADVVDEEDSTTPSDWTELVLAALHKPDEAWSEDAYEASESLIEWLKEIGAPSRNGKPRDPTAAQALSVAVGMSRSAHPRDTARDRLLERVPEFVLFEEEDRALHTVHQIGDPASRANPQPALANLLRIAALDLDTLWGYVASSDGSSVESYVDQANENLQRFFSQAWNQSNVSVRFKTVESRLEVWLKELGVSGHVTNIEERSDGLRTFVALSAFLASRELAVPPILLIDEAETHLHYDAQADLVGVLLKQVDATQVFYTTHSPGCLPTDLGTGIRLLRKDPERINASSIRADFWTNQEPGFAPLLYAMGASAAAFSACRLAVLAEGAADMILLPTLIRMATGREDLEYQVAPGLSNANAFGMRIEEVAARVVYLTDGDAAGKQYRAQLEAAGAEPSRIFSLPDGYATEDLVARGAFVTIVNTLLPGGVEVTLEDLNDGQPIVKSLEDWGARESVRVPGHVAIAYGLVNRVKDLNLAPRAKSVLCRLHESFTRAFE